MAAALGLSSPAFPLTLSLLSLPSPPLLFPTASLPFFLFLLFLIFLLFLPLHLPPFLSFPSFPFGIRSHSVARVGPSLPLGAQNPLP